MDRNHISLRPDRFKVNAAASGLVQRKCACGNAAALGGDCAGCRSTMLQRSAWQSRQPNTVPNIVRDVLNSPGEMLSPELRGFMAERFGGVRGFVPQSSGAEPNVRTTALSMNHPGDRFEREADRIATQIVDEPGRTAPEATIASYAHAFDRVRIHRDVRAEESARAIGARAYAVGPNIVFGNAAYAPETRAGRHLLAHELTHTVQQGQIAGLIMGTWDTASECSDAATDKWIEKIVVDQETPQTVTAFWSDGSSQSDACSTGKGHCCVDSVNPSGVACTVAKSHADGSNCTPITLHNGFPVKNRVRNHKGVEFWTEVVPDRAIALHKYSPVDGTPLSHGCVRMNEAMAKTIFCNVRQNKTWVQVHGFARPSCDHGTLQDEWLGDFAMGGRDLSKADGDTAGEIRETRRELNAAFGRTLTVDEIQKLAAKDIPRCSATAPLPKPAGP